MPWSQILQSRDPNVCLASSARVTMRVPSLVNPGSGSGSAPAPAPDSAPGPGSAHARVCKERLCPLDEHEAGTGTGTGTHGNGPTARSR